MKHSQRFDHTPASVPLARRFASGVLKGAAEDVRDMIALMVSELASNCIRHADSGFEITVIETADAIRVEASDGGGGEPEMRTPGPADPNGRGLRIVDMLSSSWGFEPLGGGGKTVWFTLESQVPLPVEGSSA